jgi:hypothetical protein
MKSPMLPTEIAETPHEDRARPQLGFAGPRDVIWHAWDAPAEQEAPLELF